MQPADVESSWNPGSCGGVSIIYCKTWCHHPNPCFLITACPRSGSFHASSSHTHGSRRILEFKNLNFPIGPWRLHLHQSLRAEKSASLVAQVSKAIPSKTEVVEGGKSTTGTTENVTMSLLLPLPSFLLAGELRPDQTEHGLEGFLHLPIHLLHGSVQLLLQHKNVSERSCTHQEFNHIKYKVR